MLNNVIDHDDFRPKKTNPRISSVMNNNFKVTTLPSSSVNLENIFNEIQNKIYSKT